MTPTGKRILGVLDQYGPEVAFLTGEIMVGSTDCFAVRMPFPVQWIDGLTVFRERFPGPFFAEQYRAILERDHRPVYLVGRPSTVPWTAGPQICPKIIPWVARQVHGWLAGEAAYRAGGSDRAAQVVFYAPMVVLSMNLVEIVHWVEATRPNLLSLSMKQVLWRTRLWEARVSKGALAAERPPSPVVFEHEGYRVERLETPEALEYEGRLMRHCVGQLAPAVRQRQTEIFSILDPGGLSRGTVELRPRTAWCDVTDEYEVVGLDLRQARGRRNGPITDPGAIRALVAYTTERGVQTSVWATVQHALLI